MNCLRALARLQSGKKLFRFSSVFLIHPVSINGRTEIGKSLMMLSYIQTNDVFINSLMRTCVSACLA